MAGGAVAEPMWQAGRLRSLCGGWLRIRLIIRLSQPSLAGVGAGAELGKRMYMKNKGIFIVLQ